MSADVGMISLLEILNFSLWRLLEESYDGFEKATEVDPTHLWLQCLRKDEFYSDVQGRRDRRNTYELRGRTVRILCISQAHQCIS